MNNKGLSEFIRFCIVGAFCAGIDLLLFNICKFFAPYQLCVIVGFVVSWIVNYFLTSFWTFKEKPSTSNFFGMIVAHLINLLVVRMGIMYILVDVMQINSRIAYVPTLVIAAVTSFIMVRFCFKHKKV